MRSALVYYQIYGEELKKLDEHLTEIPEIKPGKEKIEVCISYSELCTLSYEIESKISKMARIKARLVRYASEWTFYRELLADDLPLGV